MEGDLLSTVRLEQLIIETRQAREDSSTGMKLYAYLRHQKPQGSASLFTANKALFYLFRGRFWQRSAIALFGPSHPVPSTEDSIRNCGIF